MKARIALAMTETNTAYAQSGVLTRLRLVHAEEFPYTETGNLNTDLTRFSKVTGLRQRAACAMYAGDMLAHDRGSGGAAVWHHHPGKCRYHSQATDRGCQQVHLF
jgi:hypothetical protein